MIIRLLIAGVIAAVLSSCANYELRPHGENHTPYETWNHYPDNS
jgi:hypothetical protein